MTDQPPETIVPGVTLTAEGEAEIDGSLHIVLFDLALTLEERTDLAVDVQHVLAAVIMAARAGDIPRDQPLQAGDESLCSVLVPRVEAVFKRFGGAVSDDDLGR